MTWHGSRYSVNLENNLQVFGTSLKTIDYAIFFSAANDTEIACFTYS